MKGIFPGALRPLGRVADKDRAIALVGAVAEPAGGLPAVIVIPAFLLEALPLVGLCPGRVIAEEQRGNALRPALARTVFGCDLDGRARQAIGVRQRLLGIPVPGPG